MAIADFLQVVVAGLVGGGAGAAAVIYLSKKLLDHKLARDLHGFTTRYTRLDKQRTDAVLQIHGLLCEVEDLLIWGAGPGGTAIVSRCPEKRTMQALNKAWEGIEKLNGVLGFHIPRMGVVRRKLEGEFKKALGTE
ncbi:hypothetical protein [Hydrocarboniphaga sp.]|uniref:hypothetical protein n=1 Tax=Hydrocarboniphaga sp. TaxID=2033016 RepID=UPI00262C4707|nr:hypothetical protein [Hydrocarboniphaga sp.]